MLATPVLFSLVALCSAPQWVQTLDAELIRSIEEVIETEMEAQDLVGLSVAVGLGGELAWTAGYGLADLENDVPATENTVYRLASISKPVTAAAVMQLAEQGEIDLDAPVETYVREWPEKRWPVTTRQLLAHQGGIRHYVDADNMNNTRAYTTATESLVVFIDDPLIAEPGTRYSYSSFGYNLLGAIVEGASGMTFVEYLNEHVFPLAGTAAMQDDSQSRIIEHRARGYRQVGDELRNSMLDDTSYKVGGGGLCSTAADLVRFAQAMAAGEIVEPETRDQMWTAQTTALDAPTEYGLGWTIRELNGRKVVGHSGSQTGVRTGLFFLVDDGVVVSVMCNCEWSNPARFTTQIARILVSAR